MEEKTCRCLIPKTKESYGDSFKSDLLEQYKLYVQSAENVSARRVASNRYMLALNTALIALCGFLLANLEPSNWTFAVPIVGACVSMLWFEILKSHADLNKVKFKLIHELERHLPAIIYAYEWKLAGEGKGKVYRAVTKIEYWIPFLFALLYLGLAIVMLQSWASQL